MDVFLALFDTLFMGRCIITRNISTSSENNNIMTTPVKMDGIHIGPEGRGPD